MYMFSKKITPCNGRFRAAGADELAGGYRKHLAEFRIRNVGIFKREVIKIAASTGQNLPINRSGKWDDLNRKLQKLMIVLNEVLAALYWNCCQFIPQDDRRKLLGKNYLDFMNPFLSKLMRKTLTCELFYYLN